MCILLLPLPQPSWEEGTSFFIESGFVLKIALANGRRVGLAIRSVVSPGLKRNISHYSK
jgi:hypothetical protein